MGREDQHLLRIKKPAAANKQKELFLTVATKLAPDLSSG
jgi:hypothetical protein